MDSKIMPKRSNAAKKSNLFRTESKLFVIYRYYGTRTVKVNQCKAKNVPNNRDCWEIWVIKNCEYAPFLSSANILFSDSELEFCKTFGSHSAAASRDSLLIFSMLQYKVKTRSSCLAVIAG